MKPEGTANCRGGCRMPWEAAQQMVDFDPKTGLFLFIGWNRKLQSDSRATAHPIDA